jgi:hypothetical protein
MPDRGECRRFPPTTGQYEKDGDDKYVAGYRFPMVFTTWNCGEWTEMTAKQKNAQASEDRSSDT